MARSVGRIELLGRVGVEPEMGYTPSGTPIVRLRLATYRPGPEETDWHTLLFWGRLAEVVSESVKKGERLYVAGSLGYRTFEGREGRTRQVAEVHARAVVFLEPRPVPEEGKEARVGEEGPEGLPF